MKKEEENDKEEMQCEAKGKQRGCKWNAEVLIRKKEGKGKRRWNVRRKENEKGKNGMKKD